MKRSERIVDHLNLDDVWNNPQKPWSFWADKVGAHPNSVADAFRREGWKRDGDGKLSKAPCIHCYKITDRKYLNEERICSVCDHPNRDVYENELRKFLERHPHMVARVHREL